MGMAAAVVGEEGWCYDLARKLESVGVWRTWLGDTLYSSSLFQHSLSSPSSWNSFLSHSKSKSKSKSDIQLELRVRALLFDKAAAAPSSSNPSNSYLQLHADDLYFTLEHPNPNPDDDDDDDDDSKVSSLRFRQQDFPDTWYDHFIHNYKPTTPYMLSSQLLHSDQRTPPGMSNYLHLLDTHKRRRLHFNHHHTTPFKTSNSDDTLFADHTLFFPETMFLMNCVPDNVLPPTSSINGNKKVDFNGVLDTLPKLVTKTSSSIMLERLGIRPEYLSMEQGGSSQSLIRPGFDANTRQLGQEQALQMSKKIVARVLTNVGFEVATEIPIEVLSQLLNCHISKLGRILKLLADSYRKQCSAIELIKMFLHTGGHSLSSLAEHVKDTRPVLPQTPQQVQNPQPHLASPQHNTLQLPQQVPRQMHPQIPQMVRPHNLTPQQLEMLRRRQASSPRPIMNMDNNRPMVEVKLENPPELPIDTRLAQNHWRQQQQFAALQRFGHQVRQPTSTQMPLMHIPSVGAVRAQPVKVEGFQELMGGDSSLKQNTDENKLASPSK